MYLSNIYKQSSLKTKQNKNKNCKNKDYVETIKI